jgi:hypothetical protein
MHLWPQSGLIAQQFFPGAGIATLQTQLVQAEQTGHVVQQYELRRSLVEAYKDQGDFDQAAQQYDENLDFIAANQGELGRGALITLVNHYRQQEPWPRRSPCSKPIYNVPRPNASLWKGETMKPSGAYTMLAPS